MGQFYSKSAKPEPRSIPSTQIGRPDTSSLTMLMLI
nr:MAG TPA: hypothetical protein [Caudoviricetes sp.]